ncbi:MAG: type II secretion system F family protein [Treponema sp.]|nr:type II secretion system F family protein [Treponema sp.]
MSLNENSLLLFTAALEELLSGGIPLSKSLKTIFETKPLGKKVCFVADEIFQNLNSGSSFFVALKKCSQVIFPAWYLAFIECSEKSGKLNLIVKNILVILQKKKANNEKFASSLVYPVFVAILALFGGFFAFHFLSDFSSGLYFDGKNALKSSFETFFPAMIFLFSSYFCVFLLMKKILPLNPAILVFQSLAFLSKNSVPIVECVKSCFSFAEKSRKLESTLILTEERILSGWKISESFSKSFEENGLKNEARLLKLNLSLCQMTGKNDGFSKVARSLEEKSAKRAERFLGILQPSLMFITAFYLWLLLKDIFLPVFMGIGGDL